MKRKATFCTLTILIGLLLISVPFNNTTSIAQNPPPPTRPTYNPTPTPTPSPSGPVSSQGIPAELHGSVLRWGMDGLPNAQVTLSGDGWTLTTVSGPDGSYHFDRVGDAIALLNLALPEGSELHPLTQDVAVRVRAGHELIVNLGAYGAEAPAPGAHIEVDETIAAIPGDEVTLPLSVTNNWPIGISQTILTCLLPDGISLSAGETPNGRAWTEGNLLLVDLGGLLQGETRPVTLTLHIAEDLASDTETTTLPLRFSLLYSENVAVQATTTINIQKEVITILPVTGAELWLPLAGVLLAAFLIGIHQWRQSLGRAS